MTTSDHRLGGEQAASGNPNQPRIGRRELLTLISSIMALMALGIDLMLPAFGDIREAYDLGEGSNRTGQVVTVFFLGLAVAQVFYGSLADRFGRKPILYLGIGIYMLGAVGSALAPTFEVLLISRFVWGVGAAAARVVATAIIRDRFEGNVMAKAMSQIMAVFVLVPVIAPSIGAAIIAVFPWRAVFWFCVVWAGAIWLWSLRLRETLKPEHVQPLSLSNSLASYRRAATTTVTAGYTVATLFYQAVMTTYLATSELLISDLFDREAQFPFIFGAVAATFGVGAIINGRFVERYGIDRMVLMALVAGLPLAALLVIVSVAADGAPNFWVFFPLLALVLGSFMFLMPNLNTAAMTPVGDIAGSASAFTGSVRTAGGALLATIAAGQITESVTPFAVATLVFCIGGALSIAYVRWVEAKGPTPVPAGT